MLAIKGIFKWFIYFFSAKGKDPSKIWDQIEKAIEAVCLAKEPFIIKLLSAFPSKRNFFEMVRFDFVIDEDLNVYIMEVIFSTKVFLVYIIFN